MNYKEFIEGKIIKTPDSGVDVKLEDLHISNKPHQLDIIRWAAKGGRRAIFASFGLGKTQMQLELSQVVLKKAMETIEGIGGRGLIVCPLGVRQEFKKDAKRLGIEIEYCRSMAEVLASSCSMAAEKSLALSVIEKRFWNTRK